ncbi:hypothetical protein [Thiocapsa roseopersicina]|uniref:Uncharacterized protein n=1 Tax=Thiocapsa roseopersicina TaxID=1058 RepID=A0A1H3CPM0_THIRO|nr:hypothetical protein [Thiocapsa roseopersicina]SDX55848.1 hypothetical protein SAMN05421783_13617 [Thiocapsa roseopersicina]
MSRDLRPEMWRAIRRVGAHGAVFRVPTVRGQLCGAIRRERVRDYIQALEAGGYLSPVRGDTNGKAGPWGWQLIRDPGTEAPRVRANGSPVTLGAGREQCWRSMRILGSFTIPDLVATASTELHRVAEGEARDYCDRLARAGILARTRSPAGLVYQLPPSRYTGPRPPQIRRTKAVYDGNTGQLYAADGTLLATGVPMGAQADRRRMPRRRQRSPAPLGQSTPSGSTGIGVGGGR